MPYLNDAVSVLSNCSTLAFRAEISVTKQSLSLWEDDVLVWACPVSTAKNGTGYIKGSGKTPLGKHYVRACIGKNLHPFTVLRGRRPTGEIWSPALAQQYPERDWILGRILWLCGLESGVNRGGQQDTFQRYIYLHGSPENQVTGKPESHGCIRLKPDDMCYLYDQLSYGSWIEILP